MDDLVENEMDGQVLPVDERAAKLLDALVRGGASLTLIEFLRMQNERLCKIEKIPKNFVRGVKVVTGVAGTTATLIGLVASVLAILGYFKI